ncbi:DUF1254 domain-containing protein [Pseudomonas schmalbachii]|uniref:DUF1254 domain-containing protein n=1 Tax=Pseudomonas schmalbachii TaxID=2816993 RepID=A0ABS3TPQ7_9PSED|nr:DUF1254 domain-containing protein [Pseudomonas schmalbachii]MBO3275646.1 DUF1254 domain-containing protein [Pseudomonas schmalbachii]
MNKRSLALLRNPMLALGLLGVAALPLAAHAAESPYEFKNGYPTEQTVKQVYDDIDLNRAIQSYRFFYPNVAFFALWKNNVESGVVPNQTFNLVRGNPKRLAFTANSDTPYGSLILDLSSGPMVVELPPGPLMCVANDINQRWVADLGLPGPDAGKGGKHLILPPGYKGEVPEGYYVHTSTTNGVVLLLRALPKGGIEAANQLMQTVKVHPLKPGADWKEPTWHNLGAVSGDSTPLKIENGIGYWKMLHELIDSEPANPEYSNYYGELAALGIAKGKPFAPDARMMAILEKAAQMGNAQLRVQSLADRRAERVVWPDRHWEWAVLLQPESNMFVTPNYVDLESREKWFYQAMVESPAMFRRAPGAGSLYWLGARDDKGAYLDGGKTYKLRVPLPVPNKLFWSVTVYDSATRSQVQTSQDKAVLSSMFDLKDASGDSVELYFGPEAPKGQEKHWIKTNPGQGWFTYFRVYGPEKATFDGTWKPGDFELVN